MITPTSATDLLSHPAPKPHANPRRRARIMRTPEQWQALLEEFNNSGLTRAAFCKKHRIATSSLYRWQQFFVEQSGGVADFIDVTEPLARAPEPRPTQAHDNHWQVELELGAGMVLRLRTR